MGKTDYNRKKTYSWDLEYKVTANYNKKDSNSSTGSLRNFDKKKKKKYSTKAGKMKKDNLSDSDPNEETKSNNRRQRGRGKY
jgi:hypothetical protein